MKTYTLEERKKILAKHRLFVENKRGGVCADFSEVDLSGSNFSGANLKNAMFEGAKLYGAIFSNTNLERADFSGAYLVASNFNGANLREAIFVKANLTGASFIGANLELVDFSGSNLQRADLELANLRGTVLQNAELNGVSGIPKIDRTLPFRVAETILNSPDLLDMKSWHRDALCGTTHCLAGWAIMLTPGGEMLESRVGAMTAGQLLMPSASHLFRACDDAFVEALTYYQVRLTGLQKEYSALKAKVDDFIDQFREDEDE